MKNFFIALLLGLSLIAFTTADVSAARLGGGMSFGRSFKAPTAPRVAPSAPRGATAAGAAAGAATAAKGGIGRSLLYGAAGALGFMALAKLFGLGEGFGSLLMILTLVVIGFMVFRFIMAKKLQQGAGSGGSHREQSGFQNPFSRPAEPPAPTQRSSFDSTPQYSSGARSGSVLDEFANGGSAAASAGSAAYADADRNMEVPKELNVENFLNMAKSYFTMLQKAWDSGDMDSLANYCTDDVFINLTHMRREIKGANVTEVKSLDASLAGFETTPTDYVASVLFTGKLIENGVPAQVKERWNLIKPRDDSSGWLLAGIEQE